MPNKTEIKFKKCLFISIECSSLIKDAEMQINKNLS